MEVLWITIDDNEAHSLKLIADEIFGRNNFVTTFVWEKDKGGRGDADVSLSHDYMLVYAKKRERWSEIRNLLARTETQLGRFKNPDNDPSGPMAKGTTELPRAEQKNRNFRSHCHQAECHSQANWAFSQETFQTAIDEKRAYFGRDGDSLPIIKRNLSDVRDGVAPRTWLAARRCRHKSIGETRPS